MAGERVSIVLTFDRSAWDALEYAKCLLGHGAGGNEQVIARALKEFVGALEERKFGGTSRPQRRTRPTRSDRHITAGRTTSSPRNRHSAVSSWMRSARPRSASGTTPGVRAKQSAASATTPGVPQRSARPRRMPRRPPTRRGSSSWVTCSRLCLRSAIGAMRPRQRPGRATPLEQQVKHALKHLMPACCTPRTYVGQSPSACGPSAMAPRS